MSEEILAQNINLFFKGEYIKRHFEQESDQLSWLLENWDYPMHKLELKITKLGNVFFINDVLQKYHHRKQGKVYTSHFEDVYKNEMQDCLSFFPEWLHKMYSISLQYGRISAAELIYPYDMESVVKMGIDNQTKYKIPVFLEEDLCICGFKGLSRIENEPNSIAICIDLVDEQYDLDHIIKYASEAVTSYRYIKLNSNITEYEKNVLKMLPLYDDTKETYGNSEQTRVFGLLQWDMRIQGKRAMEIKEKFNSLGFYYCRNSRCRISKSLQNDGKLTVCGYKDLCKATLARQLYGTANSIQAMEQRPITQKTSKYKIKRKMQITREHIGI